MSVTGTLPQAEFRCAPESSPSSHHCWAHSDSRRRIPAALYGSTVYQITVENPSPRSARHLVQSFDGTKTPSSFDEPANLDVFLPTRCSTLREHRLYAVVGTVIDSVYRLTSATLQITPAASTRSPPHRPPRPIQRASCSPLRFRLRNEFQ